MLPPTYFIFISSVSVLPTFSKKRDVCILPISSDTVSSLQENAQGRTISLGGKFLYPATALAHSQVMGVRHGYLEFRFW